MLTEEPGPTPIEELYSDEYTTIEDISPPQPQGLLSQKVELTKGTLASMAIVGLLGAAMAGVLIGSSMREAELPPPPPPTPTTEQLKYENAKSQANDAVLALMDNSTPINGMLCDLWSPPEGSNTTQIEWNGLWFAYRGEEKSTYVRSRNTIHTSLETNPVVHFMREKIKDTLERSLNRPLTEIEQTMANHPSLIVTEQIGVGHEVVFFPSYQLPTLKDHVYRLRAPALYDAYNRMNRMKHSQPSNGHTSISDSELLSFILFENGGCDEFVKGQFSPPIPTPITTKTPWANIRQIK